MAVVLTAAFDGDSNEIRPVLSIGTEAAEGEEGFKAPTFQLESSSFLDITGGQTQQEVFLTVQGADQFMGAGQDLEITSGAESGPNGPSTRAEPYSKRTRATSNRRV